MKCSLYKISIFLFILTALFHWAQAQYCTDSLYENGCLFESYINDVTVGSISNFNTGCNGNDGYNDYTSLSTDFEQGSTYTLSIRGGNTSQIVNMWIDMNDDSVFGESERLVGYLDCETSLFTYSESFLIPSSAPLGTHRMRIRSVWDYYTDIDPCAEYYAGEVEDYTANIVPPTNMVYLSSTTTQTVTGSVGLGDTNVEMIGIQVVATGTLNPLTITSFTLNSNGSTAFADDVTGVKIYYFGNETYFYTTDTLFGSAVDLSAPITGSIQLAQDTNYFVVTYDINPNGVFGDYLDAECTSITINGNDYTPTITAPAGNRQIQYCTPVDLYGCYFAYIDGIQLNTLSNTFSYCNGNADGYINYPATGNHTTTLQEGNSYPINLSGSPYEEEGFGVWMDLNDDGDFDDSGEFLFASPNTATGLQSGYVTVPSTTSPGEHRMRVRCDDYNLLTADQSCSQLNYGETEDYTITVAPSSCSAYFTLSPDSLIPHHYWAINQALGTPPLYYLWSWG
ncbi:MAG: GEVED domain-containing protein, partial [Chitinophagales bacterium]